MGSPIKDEDREILWEYLSEFFTSFPVELLTKGLQIAARYPLGEVEELFFDEIAPACSFNLTITTPALEEGFDREWIIEKIRQGMAYKKMSRPSLAIRRLYYRCIAGGVWKEVESAIRRQRQANEES